MMAKKLDRDDLANLAVAVDIIKKIAEKGVAVAIEPNKVTVHLYAEEFFNTFGDKEFYYTDAGKDYHAARINHKGIDYMAYLTTGYVADWVGKVKNYE